MCSLSASAGADGVFVEVCRFECSASGSLEVESEVGHNSADGSFDGVHIIDMYRHSRAKQYRLHIHSVHVPDAKLAGGASSAGSGADNGCVSIAELSLMEADLEVDSLQLLHTMHNLGVALRSTSRGSSVQAGQPPLHPSDSRPGDPGDLFGSPTRDSSGKLAEAPLRRYFSLMAPEQLTMSETQVQTQMVGERCALQASCRAQLLEVRALIDASRQRTQGSSFLHLLTNALQRSPTNCVALSERLAVEPGLTGSAAAVARLSAITTIEWCDRQLSESEALRTQLLSGLDHLPTTPTELDVLESGNCGKCRRDWGKRGAECMHCKLETLYTVREAALFSYRRQRKVAEVALGPIDDAGAAASNMGEAFMEEAPAIVLVKVLTRWVSGLARPAFGGSERLHELAAQQSEEFALLKRELRSCRALWSAHFDLLSQLDELQSATHVMTLTDDPQVQAALPEIEKHTVVGTWEFEERWAAYERELAACHADLRRARGQLAFLRRMAANGSAASDCPVCMTPLSEERMVGSCGHSLCCQVRRSQGCYVQHNQGGIVRCTVILVSSHLLNANERWSLACSQCAEKIMQMRSGRFICPMCNELAALSHASGLQWLDGSCAGSNVKGSWGTKVTAVVEEVLKLPEGDKCLVFSVWDDMLSLLEKAS